MPSPFFTPTISAASTAIQAAKKLIRSMVKTCGSTAGKDHPRPYLRLGSAEAACGLDQPLVDRLDRRHRRNRQNEIDAHEHDEYGGWVANAEQHDAKRYPRDRRDRSKPAHQRQDHVGKRARRRNQDAGGESCGKADGEPCEHAQRAHQNGDRDRHGVAAEADAEIALDGITEERRGRREQNRAAPTAGRRKFPDRDDDRPRHKSLEKDPCPGRHHALRRRFRNGSARAIQRSSTIAHPSTSFSSLVSMIGGDDLR